MMIDTCDELARWEIDLKMARRWFEQARECNQRGERQTAEYCCDRGMETIDRIERRVLELRAEAQAVAA